MGLYETYGIQFDRNHSFEITTKFVMEQIINPDTGRYRTENIFSQNNITWADGAPNWLIMMKM